MNICAIILCAGKGERALSPIIIKNDGKNIQSKNLKRNQEKKHEKKHEKKQWVNFGSFPVFYYSLWSFLNYKKINKIFFTFAKDDMDKIDYFKNKYNLHSDRLSFVPVKSVSRSYSVNKTLEYIANENEKYDACFIHDAARCYLTKKMLKSFVKEVKNNNQFVDYDAFIPGTKITDAIKKVNDNLITQNIDRDGLYSVQTPQIFNFTKLHESYKNTSSEDILKAADDCEIALKNNLKIKIINGFTQNKKITFFNDFTSKPPKIKC